MNAVVEGIKAVLTAAALLAIGRALDWWIKRRAERIDITTKERTTRVVEETAEDNRLESIADRFQELAEEERKRADQIGVERDEMVKKFGEKFAQLSNEVSQLRIAVSDRDRLISEQAQKIARLEREVRELKDHDRRDRSPV